ncbi:MAG: hypothetical protein ACYCSR_15390 [Thiomonas sp.]
MVTLDSAELCLKRIAERAACTSFFIVTKRWWMTRCWCSMENLGNPPWQQARVPMV